MHSIHDKNLSLFSQIISKYIPSNQNQIKVRLVYLICIIQYNQISNINKDNKKMDQQITQELFANMFQLSNIVGMFMLALIAGLSSLVGLGGGASSTIVLMLFFEILPKQAIIIVYACIFGSSFGSIIDKMQVSHDGKPIINYHQVFISLPLIFIGALFGVHLNVLLPSLFTIATIMSVSVVTAPKIYARFKAAYKLQTETLHTRFLQNRQSEIIKQARINPFDDEINVKIFKQIGWFILSYLILVLLRGSKKFPSFLNIQACSLAYWMIQLAIFGVAYYYFLANKQALDEWTAPNYTLGEELFEKVDHYENNKSLIIKGSLAGGIMSGFGIGGGTVLVPLFRELKMTALESSNTCTFIIFINSFLNCCQAIFIGVLSFSTFIYFCIISGLGGYFLSILVTKVLKKLHRLSYVQCIFLFLITTTFLIFPINLYIIYINNDRDLSLFFGFGWIC